MPSSIRIYVGKAKAVEVVFPGMARADLIDILSTFFTEEKPEMKAKLEAVLHDSGDITMKLTTIKNPAANPTTAIP